MGSKLNLTPLINLILEKLGVFMCSPKAPKVEPVKQETIAAPTIADASVQRAGSAQKNKTAALAKKDIKTTARGLGDPVITEKKRLLGE